MQLLQRQIIDPTALDQIVSGGNLNAIKFCQIARLLDRFLKSGQSKQSLELISDLDRDRRTIHIESGVIVTASVSCLACGDLIKRL